MKCPKCKTVIPRARSVLSAAERKLPKILQMFADVVGVDAALAIAKSYGGQRVFFQSRSWIEAGHPSWLVDLIGREKALQLVGHLNVHIGDYFEIPFGPAHGPALKYLKIKEARGNGMSVNEIAKALDIRRGTVFYYLAAIRREEATKQAAVRKEESNHNDRSR
jgi:hypothetical protein